MTCALRLSTVSCGLLTLFAACHPNPPEPPKKPQVEHVPPSVDRLGERPSLAAHVPFKAVAPNVFKTEQGLTVWLIERPALPIVSLTLNVPTGSADDPAGKPGLAFTTADMLDEGAGKRGAIEISSAIEDLGAQFATDAGLEGSNVRLTVLKKYLPVGFGIFADVIARPRFEEKEYKRVNELWQNALRRRDDDPMSVSRVVRAAVLFGGDTPYGHPTSGQLDVAKTLKLAEVKDFYAAHWRPDRATLVVAGDITRAELEGLLKQHLLDWKKPAAPLPSRTAPTEPRSERPRLVLVDRPEAPQAVISVVAPGIRASDSEAAPLDLVNTALGGSFTSRLNQNLREDHHWTYGAGSVFNETRGVGSFVAQSAVVVDHTGPALREMLSEIGKMRDGGLTPDELERTRARDITDLIQTNETVDALVARLARLAELELPPDFDSVASTARQAATRAALQALAQKYLDATKASIVVVGPRAVVEPQLQILGLGEPATWTPTGQPVK